MITRRRHNKEAQASRARDKPHAQRRRDVEDGEERRGDAPETIAYDQAGAFGFKSQGVVVECVRVVGGAGGRRSEHVLQETVGAVVGNHKRHSTKKTQHREFNNAPASGANSVAFSLSTYSQACTTSVPMKKSIALVVFLCFLFEKEGE